MGKGDRLIMNHTRYIMFNDSTNHFVSIRLDCVEAITWRDEGPCPQIVCQTATREYFCPIPGFMRFPCEDFILHLINRIDMTTENINLNKLLKEFCAIAFQEDNTCFQN